MASERRKLTKEGMGIREGIPLTVSDGGVDELRGDIQRLMDIEAIKQLKHAYFRCVDTANFDELETIFHEDVSVHFVGGAYEWKLQGRDEYLGNLPAELLHPRGHRPPQRAPPGDPDPQRQRGDGHLVPRRQYVGHDLTTSSPPGTAIYWDPLPQGRRPLDHQGHQLRAHLRDESRPRGEAAARLPLPGRPRGRGEGRGVRRRGAGPPALASRLGVGLNNAPAGGCANEGAGVGNYSWGMPQDWSWCDVAGDLGLTKSYDNLIGGFPTPPVPGR